MLCFLLCCFTICLAFGCRVVVVVVVLWFARPRRHRITGKTIEPLFLALRWSTTQDKMRASHRQFQDSGTWTQREKCLGVFGSTFLMQFIWQCACTGNSSYSRVQQVSWINRAAPLGAYCSQMSDENTLLVSLSCYPFACSIYAIFFSIFWFKWRR